MGSTVCRARDVSISVGHLVAASGTSCQWHTRTHARARTYTHTHGSHVRGHTYRPSRRPDSPCRARLESDAMQYDVDRLDVVDVEDWTRTAGCTRSRLARHQRGEPAPGGLMMQLAKQQRQCPGGGAGPVRLATSSSPTRSSSACVSWVTRWLHGDGRLVAALVTSHWTSPTWPTSGPPHRQTSRASRAMGPKQLGRRRRDGYFPSGGSGSSRAGVGGRARWRLGHMESKVLCAYHRYLLQVGSTAWVLVEAGVYSRCPGTYVHTRRSLLPDVPRYCVAPPSVDTISTDGERTASRPALPYSA